VILFNTFSVLLKIALLKIYSIRGQIITADNDDPKDIIAKYLVVPGTDDAPANSHSCAPRATSISRGLGAPHRIGWLYWILNYTVGMLQVPFVLLQDVKQILETMNSVLGPTSSTGRGRTVPFPELTAPLFLTESTKETLTDILTQYRHVFETARNWGRANMTLGACASKCIQSHADFETWLDEFSPRIYHSEIHIAIAWFKASNGRLMIPLFGEHIVTRKSFLLHFTPSLVAAMTAVVILYYITSIF